MMTTPANPCGLSKRPNHISLPLFRAVYSSKLRPAVREFFISISTVVHGPVQDALHALAPALARFAPSRTEGAMAQSDRGHLPYQNFRGHRSTMQARSCLLGAVEIAYVQPIREKQERSVRLQSSSHEPALKASRRRSDGCEVQH